VNAAAQVAEDFRLPDSLTELDQWVLWRAEHDTKVPYSVSGRKASSTDSQTWSTYETAFAGLRANPTLYSGIGIVFTELDPLVGIDLDDCLDASGEVKPWARIVVERFGDTYCEVSPSGLGLKIWARGSLPANVPTVAVGDGGIELYDHARYFTVTGRAFRGAPLQIEDHAQDVLALYARLTLGRSQKWPLQPLRGGRIPFGRQHSTLVSICGTLRARQVCEEAILACLQIINANQCEKPGPLENIRRIVHSSRSWGRSA
jgi:hypothetical protein